MCTEQRNHSPLQQEMRAETSDTNAETQSFQSATLKIRGQTQAKRHSSPPKKTVVTGKPKRCEQKDRSNTEQTVLHHQLQC